MTAKKKPDRHKTARKTVQFPADWYAVAEELASDQATPTLWLLIQLVKREAEAKGKKDLPSLPWKPKTDAK